jgi:hypothetical protein
MVDYEGRVLFFDRIRARHTIEAFTRCMDEAQDGHILGLTTLQISNRFSFVFLFGYIFYATNNMWWHVYLRVYY